VRPATADAPYDVRLCVGVYGAYASVESLKQASGNIGKLECPAAGATVGSDVLRTRSDDGRKLELDLTLPNQPGFYDVRQIAVSGSEPSSSYIAAAGIIQIR
jgi:hypothetical protein